MKKILLLAGIVAAMASCTKSEISDVNIDNPNYIKFATPYTSASTKAEMDTDALVSTEAQVGVYAVTANAITLAGAIIENTQLDGGNSWVSSAAYYWPSDGSSYDFYAYHPFNGTADVAHAEIDDIITTSAIKATADAQVDILASGKVTANTNDVPLVLAHMLSKVDFQVIVKSEKTDGNLEVVIKSLTLHNVNEAHAGLNLMTPAMVDADEASLASYTYSTGAALSMLSGSAIATAYTGAVAGTTYSLDGYATDVDDIESTAFLLLPQAYVPFSVTYATALEAATAEINEADYADDADMDADGAQTASEKYAAAVAAAEAQVNQDVTTTTAPYITIEYAIAQKGILIAGAGTYGDDLAGSTISDYKSTALPLPAFVISESHANQWIKSNSYMYTLTFDESILDDIYEVTPILFEVTADSWTENGNYEAGNISSEN
ncbi:MAG: fimbrillin family protein [Rikenellaceae bacterium]